MFIFQNPFPLHLREFFGQRASVCGQIISHLLSVIWYRKRGRLVFLVFFWEKSGNFFPKASVGENICLFHIVQLLLDNNRHEIVIQFFGPAVVMLSDIKYFLCIQKEKGCRFNSYKRKNIGSLEMLWASPYREFSVNSAMIFWFPQKSSDIIWILPLRTIQISRSMSPG